jgi:hypothetical protein
MNAFRKLALGAILAAGAAATALPAAAQSFNFGIDIGPRYEPRPYYYEHPYGYPAPMPGGDCYYDSLNGRVCTY